MADGAEGEKQEEGGDDDEDGRPVAAPGHARVCWTAACRYDLSSPVLLSLRLPPAPEL
jgi:hypothetical protein